MKIFFSLFFLFFFLSCNDSNDDKMELEIFRFENSLFNSTENNINSQRIIWNQELGAFSNYYDQIILGLSSTNDSSYHTSLLSFINHPDMKEVYDSIAKSFVDFTIHKQDLNEALDAYENLLPYLIAPKFITMFSGFNYGVIAYDSVLAIGLDFYLGEKSVFYERLRNPEYLKFQKQKKFMLANVFEALCNRDWEEYHQGNDFLSSIIYKGKVMYFLNKILPGRTEDNILRFSEDQYQWCEDNEFLIWSYFIENELLFSTKESRYMSYLNYSPFAKGMPKESPGRIAYYIGGNIIDNYMSQNKNISFEDLMKQTDYRLILKESKYKPKR